jgi:hypothetical protein
MEPIGIGELVKVATGGPDLDGIVFDLPSRTKMVVALMDPQKGPGFRTVEASAVTPREEEAAVDKALHLLIRRTPPAPPRRASAGGSGARGGQPGHAKASMHRTTGK